MFYMKVVKRGNPKSSHLKENSFFYFFNFVSIRDNGCSLNKLWSSFHDVCKSHHFAVHKIFLNTM